MKKYYITFCLMLLVGYTFAQNYEFGIVYVSNYDFKVVAIPDFASTGDTDISDVGFTLVLPAGSVDVANATALLPARTGTVDEFDAAFLTGLGLGDGTKDVFQFNMPPGQSELAHTADEQIDIFSFQITNMPTSGEVYFLLNSDPIAMGAGGVLDSFYSVNIGSGTLDYFSMPAAGLDSFMFDTLGLEENELTNLEIVVFPNPTSQFINIETKHQIDKVEVYNLLGKLVIATSNKKINVKQLESGVYLLKINTASGSLTKRIIKK